MGRKTMKSKELDLSKYRDSELVPVYKTSTKLEILKDYFKKKEQRAKDIAETAGVTAVVSGFMTPLTATAIGLGYATNPEAFTTPSMITVAAITTLGVASSVVSYIVHKNQKAKRRDYKYLKECAQAGISSNNNFEIVKTIVQEDGSIDSATLAQIDNGIKHKKHHYCTPDNIIVAEDEMDK
jgi:hypothetical protein